MPAQPPVEDDFDAWYAEAVDDRLPYRLKLLGRTWDLPAEVPAVIQLKYRNLVDHVFAEGVDPDAEVTVPKDFADKVDGRGELSWPTIIVDLTSQEQYDEWLTLGLKPTMQARVAARLLDRYVLDGSDLIGAILDAATGRPLGKAPAPQGAQKRTPAKRSTPSKRAASSTGSSKGGGSSRPGGKRSTARTSPSS